MKKVLFLVFICLVVLAGCTNDKKEVELLQEKNLLLQQEAELAKTQAEAKAQQEAELAKTQAEAKNNELFQKNIDCQKYKADVEKQFSFQPQISVFYSAYANTCLYEMISVRNGQIVSKAIGEVFGTRMYVLDQDGKVVYAKEEFGANKTYADIEKILKGIIY